jgi:hypothetical protein
MNKKINLNEKLKEGIHYKFLARGHNDKRVGKSNAITGSIYFAITINPMGGLSESEIQTLVAYALNADWIMYYSIGIEIGRPTTEYPNGTKHLHINVVTNSMYAVKHIKAFFYGLIDEKRLVSIPNFKKPDTGTIKNVSVKIESCGSNFLPWKTPLDQLSYPLKGAAIGKTRDNIKLEDYNNRTTRWTNLFEDESNQTELNYLKLAQLCIDFLEKQKHNPPYMIRSNNEIQLAREFASENKFQWSKENHVEIIARMLMIKDGDKLFQLAPGYLKKFIQDDLNKKKAEENYEQMIVEAISLNNSITQDKLDKARTKTNRRTANNKEIKSLTAANQELRTLNQQYEKEQEKMKNTIARMKEFTRDKCTEINKLKSANKNMTEELWSNTKDLFYLIMDKLKDKPTRPAGLKKVYKDSWNRLGLLAHNRKLLKPEYDKGIAEWRAQDRKPYEPPADAKVEQPTPTTTKSPTTDVAQSVAAQPEAVRQPVVRQQNRKVLHSCGKCDGCSDQTRADCARDNNLDPFVVSQIADRPKKRQKVYHESGNEDDGQDY